MKKGLLLLLVVILTFTLMAGTALAEPDKAKVEKGQSSLGTQSEDNLGDSVKEESKLHKNIKPDKLEPVAMFTDTKEHWSAKHLKKAMSYGIIRGYENGTFRPDAAVSQAEAMVIAVRVAELRGTDEADLAATGEERVLDEEVLEDDDAADVQEWAKGAAKKAMALDIINLNRFHSEQQCNRAEMAVMLAKSLGYESVLEDVYDLEFSDSMLISEDVQDCIAFLKNEGIVKGTPDGKFNPNSSVTRAEVAVMVDRIVTALENEEDGVTSIVDAEELEAGEDSEDENENDEEDETVDDEEADSELEVD